MAFFHGAYVDQTDALQNSLGQFISFEHVPSGKIVYFKAFLTKYSDAYKSNWKGETGYGRMDNVQMFQQTTRQVSIGFKVIAGSLEEAKNNLVNISTFAQMLYPTFESSGGAQTIKAAPLIKIKFMNWAQNSQTRSGLLGACGGFTFSPTMEPGVFTTRERGGTNVIYPKEVMIDTSLTIIHEHPLGWKKESMGPQGTLEVNKSSPTKTAQVVTWFTPQSPSFPYGDMIADPPVNIKQVDVANPDYVEEDLSNITKDIPAEKLKSQQEAKVERMAPKGSIAWAKARYKKLGAAAYGKPAPVRSSAPTFGSGRGPAVP